MGVAQSNANKQTELEEVVVQKNSGSDGAKAPTDLNGPGLPMVGGKRRRTRSRKARKSRKGKRR
jgi:hypothetical protein